MKHTARLLLALALVACGDEQERSAPEPGPEDEAAGAETRTAAPDDSVDVVFTRAESAQVVRRAVPAGSERLAAALRELLAGPTAQERATGIESWFSEATAGSLRSASVDGNGHAIVDLADLRGTIPNAASSTGSALLLLELNGTVFGFAEIESIEYRMEGSCDRFWDWLQYGCQTVTREDA